MLVHPALLSAKPLGFQNETSKQHHRCQHTIFIHIRSPHCQNHSEIQDATGGSNMSAAAFWLQVFCQISKPGSGGTHAQLMECHFRFPNLMGHLFWRNTGNSLTSELVIVTCSHSLCKKLRRIFCLPVHLKCTILTISFWSYPSSLKLFTAMILGKIILVCFELFCVCIHTY